MGMTGKKLTTSYYSLTFGGSFVYKRDTHIVG
jgi:hypothetical protein